MTPYKIIYCVLLVALNVISITLIGVVFLGASNANGEGAPVENEFITFLRHLVYIVIVSLLFSILTLLLTKAFRRYLPTNNHLIKNIFWIQLAGLISIFFIVYMYLWIRFA